MFTFSEEHQQQPHQQPASMEEQWSGQEMHGVTTITAQHQHR